jgi:hypothetical protein
LRMMHETASGMHCAPVFRFEAAGFWPAASGLDGKRGR